MQRTESWGLHLLGMEVETHECTNKVTQMIGGPPLQWSRSTVTFDLGGETGAILEFVWWGGLQFAEHVFMLLEETAI